MIRTLCLAMLATTAVGTGEARTIPAGRAADTATVATRRPEPAQAMQVQPFAEGTIYRVSTAPGAVTDIVLEAGETLIAVASGDTARWVIGDTTSGSGAGRRTHVLVKPVAVALATNLVITTDRRTYHLRLDSVAGPAMASLQWRYPEDELLALRRAATIAEAARPVADGLAVERLRFDYRISGDRPAWRPLRVFDDGRQTFIAFPATLGQGEAPPLFTLGADGKAELVNYRVRDRYYVVDRIFDVAELRLGLKRQEIVRITRLGAPRGTRS